VWVSDGKVLEMNTLSPQDEAGMVAAAEGFLRSKNAPRDENIDLIGQLVEEIRRAGGIMKVEQLAATARLTTRTLQRLFNEYVGVGPKWVIKRFRLQEAADLLARENEVDLPRLALELGYCDQAHFINDFRLLVGLSPAEYARRSRLAEASADVA
jgi:transcriptional regulator GlxA family with amidase domain